MEPEQHKYATNKHTMVGYFVMLNMNDALDADFGTFQGNNSTSDAREEVLQDRNSQLRNGHGATDVTIKDIPTRLHFCSLVMPQRLRGSKRSSIESRHHLRWWKCRVKLTDKQVRNTTERSA
jgi:hypothetical protein